MKLAILGCGYVAYMYRLTLPMHPELELVGVADTERSRAENMARITNTKCYENLEAILDDQSVDLVLNLTTPQSHYVTTRACLQAGKHVYSEKPLAMTLEDAMSLVALSEQKNLMLSSAPCTLMNGVAQSLWKELKNNSIGRVRLVYAEMEDGMVTRAPVKTWINEAGTAWPYVNEFETGCTVEHAGYVMSWLVAFFGPAISVTAYSDTLVEDKVTGQLINDTDDFSVACIKFQSGVVARMTNGIYAEHDHRLRFFGDEGAISVDDPRSDDSRIKIQRYHTIRRRRFLSPWYRKLSIESSYSGEKITKYRGSQTRDFCRVISDMAQALKENRAPYIGARFSLHVTELTLACHFSRDLAKQGKMPYLMTSSFEPMEHLS
ncbi:MAG: Gfo/Idh/MocA family oxidoreductase [Candidatus Sedimenticola sp. (ex Thyasira tokunagai)]